MTTCPWSKTLSVLQKTLNPGLFQVWIKPLQAELDDGALNVFAPNEFVAAWVRDRLSVQIQEAAAQALGLTPTVAISARVRNPGQAAEGEIAHEARPRPAAEPVGLPTGGELLGSSGGTGQRKPATWRFRFDDFVPGPCNELALAASKSICLNSLPSDQLYLCSAPGLGKTHLLHSIGHKLTSLSNRDRLRIACITAEEFTTRLVLALKAREVERFKSQFRESVDVLLLEDIHFLQGKVKTQDELLSTLKALNSRGCKVVFTSSFLPKEMENTDSQLVSRFCSGFLAVIEKPDMATRLHILKAKASRLQAQVPADVTELLAERITSDIRQLESCLHNLVLKARLLNRNVSLDLAWQVLDNYAVENASPDMSHIMEFICKAYSLTERELQSKSRKRHIVIARNTAFYLARKHTGLSLKAIGEQFGRRHSTVIKGITNIEREISIQTPLGRQIENTIEKMT